MAQPNSRITPASLAGAVDLSSLRRTPPPPEQPTAGNTGEQAPAASTASQFVIDVTEATFQQDILERSLTTPVVIDFWAEWCEPCKQLSPVLEKLAVEANGSWILAKVDVDANQRLAGAFRVQSIPMVVAVAGGQPIDAFTGAVPEAQLRQWLSALLEAAKQAGADGGDQPAEPEADPRLLDADQKLQDGDLDGAEAGYQVLLEETPNDPIATSGLAQIALMRRLSDVDPRQVLATAQAAPHDIDAQLLAADVEFASGEAEVAFARLIGLVRSSVGDDRDTVRTHLLGLFSIAAPDDPIVIKARRQLTAALF